MNYFNYLVLLKGKLGEVNAIKELSTSQLDGLGFFIDMPRPKGDKEEDLDVCILKCIDKFSALPINNQTIYLDIFDIPTNRRCSSGEHPVSFLWRKCNEKAFSYVPVLGFDRDADFLTEIIKLPDLKKTGLCFRLLDPIDLFQPEATLDEIRNVLDKTGLTEESIDILIDFRSLIEKQNAILLQKSNELLSLLSKQGQFRNITFAGSNFPRDMSNIGKDSVGYVERVEWKLWKQIYRNALANGIQLKFGDYGVVHPDFMDIPNITNANAKIRYCLENSWMILRGHSLRKAPKYGQFNELAMKLSKSPEYKGKSFSWGDEQVAIKADIAEKTGNLPTWVAIDMNHHIVTTNHSVRNYIRSMATPITVEA